jgi:hypothetical protein
MNAQVESRGNLGFRANLYGEIRDLHFLRRELDIARWLRSAESYAASRQLSASPVGKKRHSDVRKTIESIP